MVRKDARLARHGKDGTGDLHRLSHTPYSFKTRFESEPGTTPRS